VELILHEGRNRIVRRMLDAVGFPVVDLVRTRIGPIALAGQKPGVVRELRPEQLRELYTAVGL
jgi:23S rRNA pseudouridine2605 synthase